MYSKENKSPRAFLWKPAGSIETSVINTERQNPRLPPRERSLSTASSAILCLFGQSAARLKLLAHSASSAPSDSVGVTAESPGIGLHADFPIRQSCAPDWIGFFRNTIGMVGLSLTLGTTKRKTFGQSQQKRENGQVPEGTFPLPCRRSRGPKSGLIWKKVSLKTPLPGT